MLGALEELVVEAGLAELTMAEIAARVNCSLRTLYEIAPSRDELVLAIVDRRLHRIGRVAMEALDATQTPLEALRAYLRAVNEAVQPTTAAFSQEFADVPGAVRLLDAHEGYVIAVTQSLLDRAVTRREEAGRELSLIPVLLPGAPDIRELPPFLRTFQAVDFRDAGLEGEEPMRELVRAILGKADQSPL